VNENSLILKIKPKQVSLLKQRQTHSLSLKSF